MASIIPGTAQNAVRKSKKELAAAEQARMEQLKSSATIAQQQAHFFDVPFDVEGYANFKTREKLNGRDAAREYTEAVLERDVTAKMLDSAKTLEEAEFLSKLLSAQTEKVKKIKDETYDGKTSPERVEALRKRFKADGDLTKLLFEDPEGLNGHILMKPRSASEAAKRLQILRADDYQGKLARTALPDEAPASALLALKNTGTDIDTFHGQLALKWMLDLKTKDEALYGLISQRMAQWDPFAKNLVDTKMESTKVARQWREGFVQRFAPQDQKLFEFLKILRRQASPGDKALYEESKIFGESVQREEEKHMTLAIKSLIDSRAKDILPSSNPKDVVKAKALGAALAHRVKGGAIDPLFVQTTIDPILRGEKQFTQGELEKAKKQRADKLILPNSIGSRTHTVEYDEHTNSAIVRITSLFDDIIDDGYGLPNYPPLGKTAEKARYIPLEMENGAFAVTTAYASSIKSANGPGGDTAAGTPSRPASITMEVFGSLEEAYAYCQRQRQFISPEFLDPIEDINRYR